MTPILVVHLNVLLMLKTFDAHSKWRKSNGIPCIFKVHSDFILNIFLRISTAFETV